MSAVTDHTSPILLGDPVPRQLTAYYGALDAGRPDDAAEAFAPDALYAVPVAGPETDPRVVTSGRDGIRDRLRARGHLDRVHDVRLCIVDGSTCLIEGVTRTSDGADTFVASVSLGTLGISRYLAYSCRGARDDIPSSVAIDVTPADVPAVLDAYFGALDDGDFDAAAACFSSEVLYSHPPYRHTDNNTDDRVEFRSREQLVAAFRARGRQTFRHSILNTGQRGPHGMIEGIVFDLPNGGTGSFISSLSLDPAGLIRRYVSFYCEPSVPQR